MSKFIVNIILGIPMLFTLGFLAIFWCIKKVVDALYESTESIAETIEAGLK